MRKLFFLSLALACVTSVQASNTSVETEAMKDLFTSSAKFENSAGMFYIKLEFVEYDCTASCYANVYYNDEIVAIFTDTVTAGDCVTAQSNCLSNVVQ